MLAKYNTSAPDIPKNFSWIAMQKRLQEDEFARCFQLLFIQIPVNNNPKKTVQAYTHYEESITKQNIRFLEKAG